MPLEPVGGGDARGEAVFGLATGDQPFVDVSIEGLDPAPNGETYVLWLMLTADEGYPLSPITVDRERQLLEPLRDPRRGARRWSPGCSSSTSRSPR